MKIFLAFVLIATVLKPGHAAPPSACPVNSGRAAAPIIWAVSHRGLAKFNRQKLMVLTPGDVQPLTDEAVCAKLNQFYLGSTFDQNGWHRGYFVTGGYYMVSVYYQGLSRGDVKRGHIGIFSGKLRFVGLVENSP